MELEQDDVSLKDQIDIIRGLSLQKNDKIRLMKLRLNEVSQLLHDAKTLDKNIYSMKKQIYQNIEMQLNEKISNLSVLCESEENINEVD